MKRYVPIILMLFLTQARYTLADKLLSEQVQEAMKKSTAFLRSISTKGGYAGIYSLDLSQRYGESTYENCPETNIWIQPPGTPSVGEAYLRAYLITGDNQYLDAARDVGCALAWGQKQAGGWDHQANLKNYQSGSTIPLRVTGYCTFDDNISQSALMFLVNLDTVIDEEWLTESVELGISFFMDSQFENGAWPQWYPLRGGYYDYYTFNDNTINDCIRVMLTVHEKYGVDEYLECAHRGGNFIIDSQIDAPQSGWAQQYSHDMQPAWGREFEPPGVCSLVTVRNIYTLIDISLYTKDEAYLTPIPSAIEWLENSKISDNLWARLYELDTNKPIYGGTDGKIHYNLDEAVSGYSWQESYGVKPAIWNYNIVSIMGIDEYIASQEKSLEQFQLETVLTSRALKAREVLSALDDSGRWVRSSDSMMYTEDFVKNFNYLCDYEEIYREINDITSVDENAVKPELFSLGENYPNPFNPVSTIPFSLNNPSFVTLTIYDIIGREVTELVAQYMPQGNYSVNWNAENVACGVYFYQMKVGSFVETKRMTVIK